MDKDGYLYVSNGNKHEVRRWKIGDKNGTVVAGGNGQGPRLDQLNDPGYIFVDENHSVYVSDWGNHRVMKWPKGAREGIVVAGGQGGGSDLTQLWGRSVGYCLCGRRGKSSSDALVQWSYGRYYYSWWKR
jgi:hypothetical protein